MFVSRVQYATDEYKYHMRTNQMNDAAKSKLRQRQVRMEEDEACNDENHNLLKLNSPIRKTGCQWGRGECSEKGTRERSYAYNVAR